MSETIPPPLPTPPIQVDWNDLLGNSDLDDFNPSSYFSGTVPINQTLPSDAFNNLDLENVDWAALANTTLVSGSSSSSSSSSRSRSNSVHNGKNTNIDGLSTGTTFVSPLVGELPQDASEVLTVWFLCSRMYHLMPG